MGGVKTFPVIEIFGPTLQGEGVDQGASCYFVRFGGCDNRCTWCDSPHAVLPADVRANASKMSAAEIADAVARLSGSARWVVLSGGNPALLELTGVIKALRDDGYLVAVETQGTRYKPWLGWVDRLAVSFKPPSSKWEMRADDAARFLDRFEPDALRTAFLKLVIFDSTDLDWAEGYVPLAREYRLPLYLSAGNDAGATVGNPDRVDTRALAEVRRDLLQQSRWLTDEVLKRPTLSTAIVQSQYHVLLWGNKQGV